MSIEIISSKGILFPKLLVDQEEKFTEATELTIQNKWAFPGTMLVPGLDVALALHVSCLEQPGITETS